jgi:hypothetical protein
LHVIGKGCSEPRMILVIAGSLDFQVFSVKEEALTGIEAKAADTQSFADLVHCFTCGSDYRKNPVQVRIFGRPEPWIRYRDGLFQGALCSGVQVKGLLL